MVLCRVLLFVKRLGSGSRRQPATSSSLSLVDSPVPSAGGRVDRQASGSDDGVGGDGNRRRRRLRAAATRVGKGGGGRTGGSYGDGGGGGNWHMRQKSVATTTLRIVSCCSRYRDVAATATATMDPHLYPGPHRCSEANAFVAPG